MSETALGLEYEYRQGSATGPVLLLLHGTGGGPRDLLGLGDRLAGDAPVLAPAGPVSEYGAARWFRRLAEGVFDVDDVVARAHQLADFVGDATAAHGLTGRPVVAVGFSNGANIAAAVTLLRPGTLRAAALFSAMLPVPEPSEHDLSGTDVFLAGGTNDPMAPLESADRLAEALRSRGAGVETFRHPGGHQVTMPSVDAAATWLASTVGTS